MVNMNLVKLYVHMYMYIKLSAKYSVHSIFEKGEEGRGRELGNIIFLTESQIRFKK